jgi:protoheme IX farnesyltransferase
MLDRFMSLKAPTEIVSPVALAPEVRSLGAVCADLFKARLTTLVLITTAVGYHFGSAEGLGGFVFWHALLGTGLLAAGASALNQYWEREADALMHRTASRPLPRGEIEPTTALALGVALAIVGMLDLTFFVNPLTGVLGMLTLASYVFVYTPLKQVTTLNTLIGAVPGALPPLMGWTAATGELGAGGWALFTLLFFWQIPHFMAIAWIYREDYARGGFRMLPVMDPTGSRTGSTAVRHTVALLAFSLSPVALGLAGRWYAGAALLLGLGFLGCAIAFAVGMNRQSARCLFFASIIYLPLILGALVADKSRLVVSRSPGVSMYSPSTPLASIHKPISSQTILPDHP